VKCKGCGLEFPHLNALTKHKEECIARKDNEAVADEIFISIIPIDICPSELSYYAPGQTVGLRVEGKYTPEGVVVQEVTLIR
jgi:hypothetical protein